MVEGFGDETTNHLFFQDVLYIDVILVKITRKITASWMKDQNIRCDTENAMAKS